MIKIYSFQPSYADTNVIVWIMIRFYEDKCTINVEAGLSISAVSVFLFVRLKYPEFIQLSS